MTHNTEKPWTRQEVDVLVQLIEGKHSCSEIGKMMGRSRNAISSKARKLGLSVGNGMSGGARPGAGAKKGVTPNRPNRKPSKPPIAREKTDGVAAVMALREGFCKWPDGSIKDGDLSFCMEPCSGSYCLEHAGRAYMKSREPEARPKVSQLNFARY